MLASNVRRNDPCPCGSGKRYKECHGSVGGRAPEAGEIGTTALFEQALAAYRRQDLPSAAGTCQQVLRLAPHHASAWHLAGAIDLQRGDQRAAVVKVAKAIELDEVQAEFYKTLARAHLASGARGDAATAARRATALASTDADAWVTLGLALEADEPGGALSAWQNAVELAPENPEAHFRMGDFHRRRGNHPAAVIAYRAAEAAGARHPVLSNNLGLSLQEQGETVEAEASFRKAIAQQPGMVEASANLGDLLSRQQRFGAAVHAYEQAVARMPGAAALWQNLGLCRHRMGALTLAHADLQRASELDPGNPRILVNLAAVLLAQQREADAAPLVGRALALQPDLSEAQSMLLYICQHLCQWEDLDRLFEQQRAAIRDPAVPPVVPHSLIALPFTPPELLMAARKWVQHRIRPAPVAPPTLSDFGGDRLRIAYLGSDFREHALSSLLTEVIESHDRSRFEVIGYSFGPDDRSPARARFAAAFDRFVDVRAESFERTAARIRDDRIGILFDTSGYVVNARSEIFALRPAPIQINCIGFPGTLGADFFDYILTDRFVTPPDQQANFAERFMLLPHCYMPGDSKRVIGPVPTRQQCGLPATGLVFCCFNAAWKIHPRVFDVWMRVLEQSEGSVLWLLDTNAQSRENLRKEAVQRNVAPDRLVFAPRVPLQQHLARHAVADLFLDTFPCNAHTTANDALFAGLPILTCSGVTFASRVSGSHLRAIGLPELVAQSLEDYESVALELATRPELLANYRARLAVNRHREPLFDTMGYTRALEHLLLSAWQDRIAIGT
jgi:protein O-GlcNAc transferase